MQAPIKVEDEGSIPRSAKRLRMSTSVNVAAPQPDQPPAGAKQQDSTVRPGAAADEDEKLPSDLAGLPAEMQRVMQAEGHPAPTPVQSRRAPTHATIPEDMPQRAECRECQPEKIVNGSAEHAGAGVAVSLEVPKIPAL